jgi:hypothetical protein
MAGFPDERCAEELVGSLKSLDPQAQRVVVDAIPVSLLRLKTRAALDRHVSDLFTFYEICTLAAMNPSTPLDAKIAQQLREVSLGAAEALRGLTGFRFTSPEQAREWWNKNREEFLKRVP